MLAHLIVTLKCWRNVPPGCCIPHRSTGGRLLPAPAPALALLVPPLLPLLIIVLVVFLMIVFSVMFLNPPLLLFEGLGLPALLLLPSLLHELQLSCEPVVEEGSSQATRAETHRYGGLLPAEKLLVFS